MRTIEATIDTNGWLHTSESLDFEGEQRVLVIFLDVTDTVSFKMEEDWGISEEDQAWSHLQAEK